MKPEVTVELYGSLASLVGEKRVVVEAATLRDMFDALAARHPALADHLDERVSVSIDGRIYTEALFQPIKPENEIMLLPRIAGG